MISLLESLLNVSGFGGLEIVLLKMIVNNFNEFEDYQVLILIGREYQVLYTIHNSYLKCTYVRYLYS